MRIDVDWMRQETAGDKYGAAAEVLAFAAQELNDYLGRMLSRIDGTFRIALTVGVGTGAAGQTDENSGEADAFQTGASEEAAPSGEADTFQIEAMGDGTSYTGRIAGNSARAVLLGVYHYLYLLGCRFLGPGRALELVPKITDARQLCVSHSHTAGFCHRGVCIEGADSLENVCDFIDWLPKMGYNTCFIQFQIPYTFFARWYHHENNPMYEPEVFTPEDAVRCLEIAKAEIRKRGLLLQMVGHGWTAESVGIAAMDWNAGQYTLSEKQRSMLAMVNGKREFYRGIPMNTNLCYSNPDAFEAFSDAVVRYAAEHREVDELHVWLADDCNQFCECESCRDSRPADQYLQLLNRIDEKLTLQKLDTRIVFLLYMDLLWPPVHETIKNPDRFVMMFAPISRSFDSSYQIDEAMPPLAEYVRNRITLPTELRQNLAYLRAWQEKFAGDSFLFDYHLGRAHYGDFGYVHISRVIHDDIDRLKELKLNGQISCQEFRAGMPNFLPNYVMGRKLLDHECDFRGIVEEYFQSAYGDGWEKVLAYLSSLSALCSCDYVNGKGPRRDETVAAKMKKAKRLTEAFVAEDAAREIERRDEEIKRHDGESESPVGQPKTGEVQALFRAMLRYHCEYLVWLEDAVGQLAAGQEEAAGESWMKFIQTIREKEPEFQPYLDVYRIYEISKNVTGFQYADAPRRAQTFHNHTQTIRRI